MSKHCLQVALIRDLRRRVEAQPDPEEAGYPRQWDSDLSLDERTWWEEGWQATAAPSKATTAKLIPIVTTEEMPTIDAVELAQTYIHRWPAQENVIKDYLRPLGLDTNHGFAKVAVENSEVAKRLQLGISALLLLSPPLFILLSMGNAALQDYRFFQNRRPWQQ